MSAALTTTAGYRVDILVTGYPGKSVCHGALGWSTIALLRGHGRVALVDVGSFGLRGVLIDRLAALGLSPRDVTDVLLTHSHFDHSVNWTLFRDARIVIGGSELEWSLTQPWGETAVPELYVEKLAGWPTVARVRDGDDVLPRVRAHLAPGHTPGCLVFALLGEDQDVIFSGDAAKNRAELMSRTADMTYDEAMSRASIERIWALWQRRPGSILVPGHDLPMVQNDGQTRYLGKHDAGIRSWFGDGLDQTTLFELVVR